jgi:hypothetical protein
MVSVHVKVSQISDLEIHVVRLWDARVKGEICYIRRPTFRAFYLLLQVHYPTRRFKRDTSYTTRMESEESETLSETVQ